MKKQILSEELKRMYKLAGLINESDVDSDYIKMQIARSHGEEPTAEEMSTIMAAIQKDKERKESSLEEDMLEEDMLEEAIEGGLTFDELPQIIKDYFRRNITMSVAFVKKDGSVRHMAFRRNLKSYEGSDKEKTEKQSSVLINNNLMNVYDTNKFIQLKRETGDVAQAAKGSFRNFRLDNVLAFSVGGKIFDFRDQNQIKERFGEEVYASLTPSMISSLKSDEERGSEDVMIQEGQLGRTIAKMLIEEMLKENEEEVAKRVQELLNPHDYITLKAGTLLTINRPPGFIQIPKETEAVYFGVNKFNQVEVAVRNGLGWNTGWNTGTVEFGDIRDLFDESGSYGLEDVPPYEGPEDPMDHQVAEVMIKEGQLGKAITKMLIEEMLKEEDEEYDITDVDEIDGKYCKDFEVRELKPGDIIYRRLIDVDDNEIQWATDVNSFEPFGLAVQYSSPISFEVVEVGDNTIKLK